MRSVSNTRHTGQKRHIPRKITDTAIQFDSLSCQVKFMFYFNKNTAVTVKNFLDVDSQDSQADLEDLECEVDRQQVFVD